MYSSRKTNPGGLIQNEFAKLNELRVKNAYLEDEIKEIEKSKKGKQLELDGLNQQLGKVMTELGRIKELIERADWEYRELIKKIPIKQKEFEKLVNEVDQQIRVNKEKEENTLKPVKEEIEVTSKEIRIIREEIKLETEKKEKLIKENSDLEDELRKKRKELNKVILETTERQRNIEKENKTLDSRMASANDREKKLNFYNGRLQRFACKVGVQLKEL